MATLRILIHALALLLCQTATACVQPTITETGQKQVDFAHDQIGGLSGITYLGADDYLVVSDRDGQIAKATIVIDRQTGQITEASIGQRYTIKNTRDLEDIAYHPGKNLLLVCDESGNKVLSSGLEGGESKPWQRVPAVFANARPNLGLESLSVAPGTGEVWIANEEALRGDGPRATVDEGTLVRLQKLSNHKGIQPVQFAYRTQPHSGAQNLLKRAQSGVSGLIALPGGRLIVMERELGGDLVPSFRNRLYYVETAGGRDTSRLKALVGGEAGEVKPVAKTLLYRVDAGRTNFEGITLGPRLDNGDLAIVLVADDGSGDLNPQNLLALRLSGVAIKGGRW